MKMDPGPGDGHPRGRDGTGEGEKSGGGRGTTGQAGTPKARERPGGRLDIYVVLFGFIVAAAVLTWILPAGSYERTTLPDGRESVVPDSWRPVEPSPAGVMDVVTAIPAGLREAAGIVFLVLLVGGSVGVMRRVGIVDLGIRRLTAALGHRTEMLIPLLMFGFGAVAAVVGTPELAIAWLPVVLPLMLSLGYDTVAATAVALMPTTLGFAFGVTVPATIGIGHSLAGLPMFSGAPYRLAFWIVVQAASAAYVLRYARRVRAAPGAALNREEDVRARRELADRTGTPTSYPRRTAVAGVAALVLFAGFVAGVIGFGLGFDEISGLFVAMAVAVALIAGRRLHRICDDFNDSFREMLTGALICGVARGVSVVLVEGNVMDTVVHHLAGAVASLPETLTAVGVLLAQAGFNFLVPSGAGQSLMTLPILIPVADLTGMTRQVVVLATHWGDGITNIVFPTSGYFLATLVLGRVGLRTWLRFYMPFFWFVLGVAIVGLVLAQTISLGPF